MNEQQTTIKITGVETKLASNGHKFMNVKDAENKNYKVWETQYNEPNPAYSYIAGLGAEAVGKEINVIVEFQPGKYQGKDVTYRTIKAINKAMNKPQATSGDDVERLLKGMRYLVDQLMKFIDTLDKKSDSQTWDDGSPIEEPPYVDEEDIRVEDVPF